MCITNEYLYATDKLIHSQNINCVYYSKAPAWLSLPRSLNLIWSRMTLHWQCVQVLVAKDMLKKTQQRSRPVGTIHLLRWSKPPKYWEEIFCFRLLKIPALPWLMTACFQTKTLHAIAKWLQCAEMKGASKSLNCLILAMLCISLWGCICTCMYIYIHCNK